MERGEAATGPAKDVTLQVCDGQVRARPGSDLAGSKAGGVDHKRRSNVTRCGVNAHYPVTLNLKAGRLHAP
jgi:hypothetical protein